MAPAMPVNARRVLRTDDSTCTALWPRPASVPGLVLASGEIMPSQPCDNVGRDLAKAILHRSERCGLVRDKH